MTNDVKFTFSVGDNTQVAYILVLSNANRIGDNIYCGSLRWVPPMLPGLKRDLCNKKINPIW